METLKSFLIIIVVVLSFGVAVIAGRNGLLSARCAARCLTEHKDSLRGWGPVAFQSRRRGFTVTVMSFDLRMFLMATEFEHLPLLFHVGKLSVACSKLVKIQGSDRNSHRKFLIDRCKVNKKCFECMKPCKAFESDLIQHKCDNFCEVAENECKQSCEFLHYTYLYKTGDCPSPNSATDFEAVCLTSCREDSDCIEDLKCCPNMCGYVCRKPDYSLFNVPLVPTNLTCEERRQGRSLRLTWTVQESIRTWRGVGVYILEQRNTTTQKPVWNENTPWEILAILHDNHLLIEQIHAGHWYQFRVAMVTPSGTQGYSAPLQPFKSSRRVQRPMPPQNITEGATTFRKGHVDVKVLWQKPKYSDLPIWRYTITWSERLSHASPVLVKLTVLEKTLPGSVHEFKLKRLKPGTTYHIEIKAMIQHGNREFISKKASKYITTYKPPNTKPDCPDHFTAFPLAELVDYNEVSGTDEQVISIYEDIIKVEDLAIVDDLPYFDKGSLKAQLTWSVGTDFKGLVKSFMIFWAPHSCDQSFAVEKPYSATSDIQRFEIYDLQYECQYLVQVNAVTKSGVQGKPSEIKIRTPVCEKILVKGNSLHPQCPERVPQVPRSPRKVEPKIIKNNCSLDIEMSWRHPRSDLEIESYLVTYELTDSFQELKLDTEGTVYKHKPVEISLKKVKEYTIRNLKQSKVYIIKLHAVSEAGIGEPAFIEILTPRIFPCGSDKDKEPPDKKPRRTTPSPVFMSPDFPRSSTDGSTKPVSIETVTINSVTTYRTMQYPSVNNGVSNINIYKTVYYMFVFFANIFGTS